MLEAAVRPKGESCLPGLLDPALAFLKGSATVYCMVPEYQPGIQRFLSQRRFEQVAEYTTLVKSMAINVRDTAGAAVTISSR